MLTQADIKTLTGFRRQLHQTPELSGNEARTAAAVVDHLKALSGCSDIITGLGGHGVAAIYEATPGPTLLFRCELDALPIQETQRPHASQTRGIAHLCGHDGHITILLGLARLLTRRPPTCGRVVLMFQPAEETGIGGPAIVSDPRFESIRPDFAFALHNMPGLPLGYVGLTSGPVASASRGMKVTFQGSESHSAYPEHAASPRAAMARLMADLPDLSTPLSDDFRRITLTHVALGQPNFGITPGHGTLFATLRTQTNAGMAALMADAVKLVERAADEDGLTTGITYHEVFEHLKNAPEAVRLLQNALEAQNIPWGTEGGTMVPSEDFAAFSHTAPSAMLYLGAGENHPPLHTPDYDFPDALIAPGAQLFEQVVRDLLG